MKRPSIPASPLPWEHDTHGQHRGEVSPYEVLLDANGKTIADTINSDVAVIRTEHDEDGATRWDETGRKDFAFIVLAANTHADLLEAVEWFEARLSASHVSHDEDEFLLSKVREIITKAKGR